MRSHERPTWRHSLPTWPLIAAVLLIGLVIYRGSQSINPGSRRSLPDASKPQLVIRAIDGDTLLLESGHRVRLIGVDTPETKHPDRPAEPFGAEAARFTASHVEGRSVRLEYDLARLDEYQRVLAFVYLDDRLLNEELIRAGLSRAETGFAFRASLQRRFRAAEEEARQAGRGIWGSSLPPTSADNSWKTGQSR
ncbi:MAG: thermonuclease family protein [Planctomycetaceae bacterium]